jgi:hypothetical protein
MDIGSILAFAFIGYCVLMVVGSGIYWLWELVSDQGFARMNAPTYLIAAVALVAMFVTGLLLGPFFA